MDGSLLVVSYGGAPRTMLVRWLYYSGVTGDNSVRHVSHQKSTTEGVKTSGVRALSGRSEL